MRIVIFLCLIVGSFGAMAQQSEIRKVEDQPTFAGVSEGELTPAQIVDIEELVAPMTYRITSFSMTRAHNEEVYGSQVMSNLLNDNMKEHLGYCIHGDVLYFEMINALDAKGEKVILPNIKIEIKK